MQKNQSISFWTVMLLAVLTLGTSISAHATDKILRADTDALGGPGHTMIVVASKIWKRELNGISIQINDSQTLTRSALKLGNEKLELMPLPTAVADFLKTGSRMYEKKFKQEAITAYKNVRGLLGWLAVYNHALVFEDSGIKVFDDIKGKRVYVGPPSGASSVNVQSLIRELTGFEPGKDYKAVKMPWGSGLQAMLDGKVDVYFRPSGLGAASIEQLGMKKKFRILDAKTGNPEGFARFTKPSHRFVVEIPPGTYQSQVNNDKSVFTSGGTFNLAVNTKMSDDMVYGMTKAIWENLEEMQQTAATLKSIDPERPFIGLNVPLHPGAVKYYQEIGLEIPEHLIP